MLGKSLMDYSIVVRKVIELWMKENGNNGFHLLNNQ